jgi:hypothetical protein
LLARLYPAWSKAQQQTLRAIGPAHWKQILATLETATNKLER